MTLGPLYIRAVTVWCKVAANEEGPVELEMGRVIGKRWKIIDRIGEGACGAVYKVEDIQTLAKVSQPLFQSNRDGSN